MKASNALLSLVELRQFLQVARSGNFSLAARQLEQTTAAVSAGVKRLEHSLGVRLFERSTRSVRLTEEGRAFLEGCQKALNELDVAVDRATRSLESPSGHVVISAPTDLAKTLLNDWLINFQSDFPEITLSVSLADTLVDLKKSLIDLAIRYGFPADSSMIARPLARSFRIACASPEYLDAQGEPYHPYELADHNCICFHVKGQVDNIWRFFDKKEELKVNVSGTLSTDDSSLARQWALEGRGIVYKSELDLRSDIRAGRLVPLLTAYQGQESPLYVVYPSRENLPRRTQVLIQHLLANAED